MDDGGEEQMEESRMMELKSVKEERNWKFWFPAKRSSDVN